MLATAGFVDVVSDDVTARYRATQRRWIDATVRHEADLRRSVGDDMYEDRIAILMQQRSLLEGGAIAGAGGGVLTNRGAMNANLKRGRDFVKPGVAAVCSDVYAGATAQSIANYSEVPDSKRRCVRMKPPIPSRYQG